MSTELLQKVQVQKLWERSVKKEYAILWKVILQNLLPMKKNKCLEEPVTNILRKQSSKALVSQVSKLDEWKMEFGLACLEHMEKHNN